LEYFLIVSGQAPPRMIDGIAIEYQFRIVGEPVKKSNKFFPKKITRPDVQIADDNGFHI